MPESQRFGRVEVRPAERALLIDDKPVELGSRAFDLLLALIAHRDHVMTKDELLDIVWPGVVVEENNLQVQVSALRKVLGPQSIATIPGRGYQFVAAEPAPAAQTAPEHTNSAALAAPPDGLASSHTTIAAKQPGTSSGIPKFSALLDSVKRHKVWAAFVVASTVVLASAATYWHIDRAAKTEMPTTSRIPVAHKVPALSIVVLPFTNLTGDAHQAYVADALTANLTRELSRRFRTIYVVDATTAFSYKGKPVTAQQVGRELEVGFVLHGDVQRNGDKLRISAQLADATSNTQLLSDSFDGDLSDLFALYEQVILRIGGKVWPEMIVTAARDSERRKSNPQAVDLLLRGHARSMKRMSLHDLQQVEALYRQAVALEPKNPVALGSLANSLSTQATNFESAFSDHDLEKRFVEARDLALKARELDSENWHANTVLFFYALNHDDFEGARRAAERQILLFPWSSSAHHNLAQIYFYSRDAKRAIELYTQSGNLMPKGPTAITMGTLCSAHFMLGEYDVAIGWCLKSLERNPQNGWAYAYLAMAYLAINEETKAQAAVTALHQLPPGHRPNEKFERPQPSAPAAYKEWYEKQFLPAALKLGLWKKP